MIQGNWLRIILLSHVLISHIYIHLRGCFGFFHGTVSVTLLHTYFRHCCGPTSCQLILCMPYPLKNYCYATNQRLIVDTKIHCGPLSIYKLL